MLDEMWKGRRWNVEYWEMESSTLAASGIGDYAMMDDAEVELKTSSFRLADAGVFAIFLPL